MGQSWSDAAHRGRWKWAITGDYGMEDGKVFGDWKAGVDYCQQTRDKD
jgi:hypothetical protein